MRSLDAYEPIDIGKSVRNIAFTQGALFPVGPRQTSRGMAYVPGGDERSLYLPFADILDQDPNKILIERGLVGLGFIAMCAPDLEDMPETAQRDYTAAALDYSVRLSSQGRLLRTPGQASSDEFQDTYPGASAEWAYDYAKELTTLNNVLVRAPLFAAVERIRRQDSYGVKKLQIGREKQSYTVEVRVGPKDKLAVVRVPKIPKQRQPQRQAA